MSRVWLFIYNILLISLLIPVFFILLIFSGKYRKEVFYKLSERFSLSQKIEKDHRKTIWIHCSSLGEVRAIEPLMESLRKEYFIVLTSITKTGREYAKKINKADFISLLPLDIYPLMLKFFNIVKPDMLILVETELWSSMLYIADKKNVKTMTINGRMSGKSFKLYKPLRFFWKYFIDSIDIIIARNKEDAERFKYLSSGKNEIFISGNIKYDRDFFVDADRTDFGLNEDHFVFTAGSTREGEEKIIAEVYKCLKDQNKNIKIFMAPRHISKIEKIKSFLNDEKIDYVLFSEINKDKKADFILVDVFGKLQNIYSISDICYVGGSIVKKGGQNPIEPAALGKPVLFGRNMDNFKSEAEILLKCRGAFEVHGSKDICLKISEFLSDKNALLAAGKNALEAVNLQKGALKITIDKIKENING